MLELIVEGQELFNEETNEFSYTESTVLKLEHSLVSVSKWESIWEIPFLTKEEKTTEQIISYIKCMTKGDVDNEVYNRLSPANVKQIDTFINSKRSATWFNESGPTKIAGRSTEIVTSELIYYWMIAFQIPFETQEWHLYRLLNLIKICNLKNQDPKKNRMNKRDAMTRQRELNEQRKRQLGTKG